MTKSSQICSERNLTQCSVEFPTNLTSLLNKLLPVIRHSNNHSGHQQLRRWSKADLKPLRKTCIFRLISSQLPNSQRGLPTNISPVSLLSASSTLSSYRKVTSLCLGSPPPSCYFFRDKFCEYLCLLFAEPFLFASLLHSITD